VVRLGDRLLQRLLDVLERMDRVIETQLGSCTMSVGAGRRLLKLISSITGRPYPSHPVGNKDVGEYAL
jgi:hypothetical protein